MKFHFKKKLILYVSSVTAIAALFFIIGLAHADQTAYDNCIETDNGTDASCSNLLNDTSNTPSGNTSANTTDVTKAPYTLLTPLPCIGSNIAGCSGNTGTFSSIDLSDFITYAYKFMLALAVVLAVFMITVGGFEYMLSGAAGTKGDAVKKIQDAVLGLILALITYLLLYTIDPNLVSTNNLSIPPISQPAANTAASTPAASSPANTSNPPTLTNNNTTSGGSSIPPNGAE